MEYVRRVRLARCRQAFLAGPADRQTVADVAFQNGFAHLPRFAAAYRKLYHESPSDTLRRRRA
jgi:AraC-like DNA-binding protein